MWRGKIRICRSDGLLRGEIHEAGILGHPSRIGGLNLFRVPSFWRHLGRAGYLHVEPEPFPFTRSTSPMLVRFVKSR